MPPEYPTRYTLAEHEGIPLSVVAAAVRTQSMEDKVRKAGGVVFDSYREASEAAEEIIDATVDPKGQLYPDPNNGSHATGFTNKVKLDGGRLYIPVKAPEGVVA